MATSSSSGNHCAAIVSLSDFVSSSTDNAVSQIESHVVLGNEAGDADSIVSALTLAYVDSIYNNVPKTPIISIPRNDMCLRRETVYLLEQAGISIDKLHYMDDANVWNGVDSITLVDHNRLTLVEAGGIGSHVQVVEIVDHHHDENSHAHVNGDCRNVAFRDDSALVASTCTLVAERLFASDAARPPYHSDLSLVLLGVILLDSVNMNPQAQKGTARDQAAINALVHETDWLTLDERELVKREDGLIDTDKLFRRLSESKFDLAFWNELSVKDALRLDYKRFEAQNQSAFGASSILLDLDSFLSKKSLIEEIESFMNAVDIPLLVILSNRLVNQAASREMMLFGRDETVVDNLASYLSTSPAADIMQVEEIPLTMDMPGRSLATRRFKQHNPKASRKQVAPIILGFYSSSAEE